MKIEVVDNFLSDYYADSYIKLFDGKSRGQRQFSWFFCNDLNDIERGGNFYFNSILIQENQVLDPRWLPIFEPLVSRLGLSFDRVWRFKLNLYPRTQRRVHHVSHVDYPPNRGLKTCLYYINTNNGYTKFDGTFKSVKSKKNRAVLFDGSSLHHSTTPTDCNYRCSINIDYLK